MFWIESGEMFKDIFIIIYKVIYVNELRDGVFRYAVSQTSDVFCVFGDNSLFVESPLCSCVPKQFSFR